MTNLHAEYKFSWMKCKIINLPTAILFQRKVTYLNKLHIFYKSPD